MSEYWQRKNTGEGFHKRLEMRGMIAIHLVERWGTVAGKVREGEDSAGRAVLDCMEPNEIVSRCCEIAELTVAAFEERGWIKEDERSDEEVAKAAGELEQIQSDARFPRTNKVGSE